MKAAEEAAARVAAKAAEAAAKVAAETAAEAARSARMTRKRSRSPPPPRWRPGEGDDEPTWNDRRRQPAARRAASRDRREDNPPAKGGGKPGYWRVTRPPAYEDSRPPRSDHAEAQVRRSTTLEGLRQSLTAILEGLQDAN